MGSRPCGLGLVGIPCLVLSSKRAQHHFVVSYRLNNRGLGMEGLDDLLKEQDAPPSQETSPSAFCLPLLPPPPGYSDCEESWDSDSMGSSSPMKRLRQDDEATADANDDADDDSVINDTCETFLAESCNAAVNFQCQCKMPCGLRCDASGRSIFIIREETLAQPLVKGRRRSVVASMLRRTRTQTKRHFTPHMN